ncbi:Protein of unknown function, partial [Gryllus bimaculatus]
MYWKIAD